MSAFASSTAAGDVLAWPREGGGEVRQVVMARGHGKRPRLLTIDTDGSLHRLAPDKVPATAAVVGRLDLPEPYRPREPEYRREVAALLSRWQAAGAISRPAYASESAAPGGAAACPDLAAHLAAVRSARRREARLEALRRREQVAWRRHGAPAARHCRPARALGVCPRLASHPRRPATALHLQRARPAPRRGLGTGLVRRARPRRDGRPGLPVHLRAPRRRRAPCLAYSLPPGARGTDQRARRPAWPRPRRRPACR